jgi:hypothetical protein
MEKLQLIFGNNHFFLLVVAVGGAGANKFMEDGWRVLSFVLMLC